MVTYGTATAASYLGQIHELLARKRYSVSELDENVLRIQETESGIALQAVLEGDILFFSLVCMVRLLQASRRISCAKCWRADNGISTSHFQLYDAATATWPSL